MLNFEHLRPVMEAALASNIIVGSPLMAVGEGGLDDDAYIRIEYEMIKLTNLLWTSPKDNNEAMLGEHVPREVVQHCVLETLSSTAAYYSHIRLGELRLNEPMMAVASKLFDQLVRDHSANKVLSLSLLVNFYDNALAIRHYGQISREDMISGRLHRPWIRYDLDFEMNFMLDHGSVEVFSDGGVEYVRLTSIGLEKFHDVSGFLRSTGFLKKRESLMRFSRFSALTDYDTLVDSVSSVANIRNDFYYSCGVRQGMRVLELGCGTGGFTMDAGLYKLVGPAGQVVATDPSIGMLNRAKEKREQWRIANVEFYALAAEYLNFENETFDAVVGCGFLQFTDIEKTIHEIYRVLKPRGLFSTIHPLRFTHASSLFPDWFQPLLEVGQGPRQSDSMPERDTVPTALRGKFDIVDQWEDDYMANYTVPENVVRFFVEVANVFEDATNALPWKARGDMLKTLIDRGHHIVATYPVEELMPSHPIQFIRAYKQ